MLPKALLLLACLALAVPAVAVAPLWTHDDPEPAGACALSSDGKVIAVAAGQLHIFNRTGGQAATVWPANDVAVTPNGGLVVAGSDHAIRGYDRNGTEDWSLPNDSVAVAVSGDGRTVASVDANGQVTTLSTAGKRTGSGRAAVGGAAVDLAISQNGSVVVLIDQNGVHAFTRAAKRQWSVQLASPNALAMNATGGLVAVWGGGNVLFLNSTGERVARVPTAVAVRSLAMTPSGNLTVAGHEDGTVSVLGSDGGTLWTYAAASWVRRVAISSNGGVVAAVTTGRQLHLLDGMGNLLWRADLAGVPASLALSADGTTVVAGGEDGTVHAFDTGVAAPAKPTRAATRTTASNITAKATTNRTATPAPNTTANLSIGTTPPADLGLEAGEAADASAGLPEYAPAAGLVLFAGLLAAVWFATRRRG